MTEFIRFRKVSADAHIKECIMLKNFKLQEIRAA